MDNEGPGQEFATSHMRALGLDVGRFTPDEVSGIRADLACLHRREYGERPEVVGSWPGAGGGPSLHLAAHADVVPIEQPERWVLEPFSTEIYEGKIWERGAWTTGTA
jgi:acetylornithine deacetylase